MAEAGLQLHPDKTRIVCPFGHELSPGRVQIGWSPCICEPVKEAGARGRGMGHLRLYCRACEDESETRGFYEPPHDVKRWKVFALFALGVTSRSHLHTNYTSPPRHRQTTVRRVD
jgi:hypothetical protein